MQSHQNDPLGAAIVHEVFTIIWEEGLMFALDIRDAGTGDRIYRELLDRGYIICNRKGLFRIDPPLVIGEHEFEEFIRVFSEVLTVML